MESRRTIPSVVHEHAHGAQRKAIALEVWDEDDGIDGNSLHEADGLRPIHRAVLSADSDYTHGDSYALGLAIYGCRAVHENAAER